MTDVGALGELLIDFASRGTGAGGYPLMQALPGGAPANFLAALTRYGKSTAFLGKVGDDAFGHLLVGTVKDAGIEKDVADLLRAYHMEKKTVVTSFEFDYIKNLKEYAPELRVGYLTSKVDEEILEKLLAIDGDELCPIADRINPQDVDHWHEMGFRVRAWGVSPKTMEAVYDSGADGMTVNFPDRLKAYVDSKAE